jgi:hypothetical protein
MGKFTTNIFINSSQQKVFDFLSDPANLSKWNSNFTSAEGHPAMHLVSVQRTEYALKWLEGKMTVCSRSCKSTMQRDRKCQR